MPRRDLLRRSKRFTEEISRHLRDLDHSPGGSEATLAGLLGLAGLDVTIRDPDVSVLQVQGPHSPAVLRELVGEVVLQGFNFRNLHFVL